MATITRGRHKGKKCTVNQWANDWLSVDVGDEPAIISPASIVLDSDEVDRWKRDPHGMDMLYQLTAGGRFKRRTSV